MNKKKNNPIQLIEIFLLYKDTKKKIIPIANNINFKLLTAIKKFKKILIKIIKKNP